MNKRRKLMDKIDELTQDEDVQDAVKEFVDEMENKFNEISEMLQNINIDSLDQICEARTEATEMGELLY